MKDKKHAPKITFSAPPPTPQEAQFISGRPPAAKNRIAAGKVRMNLHLDAQMVSELEAEAARLDVWPAQALELAWRTYMKSRAEQGRAGAAKPPGGASPPR